MDDSRLQWRRSFKSLLFGESSLGHRFHSWPEHLFRERDRFNRDATHYSRHHHSDIGQGIESWESNSCERSSRRLILRKRRRFSLGQPLNWMKWNFLSSVSLYNPLKSASSQQSCFKVVPKHEASCSFQKIKFCVESDAKMTQASVEQRSGFALKNSEAGYCSAGNSPPRAMGCANDDRKNEFEISYCPVEEASHDDHHNDEEESSGYRSHRHAGGYNYRDNGEDDVNKDETVQAGFDIKEAFCNGEDYEDDEERYDKEESSWASLLSGGGKCSEECDENLEDNKRDYVRTGLQGGEAYCFDPRGRDDEKDEEYGKDTAEQGNEEGSLCTSSHNIEADTDEQCGDDDNAEENDEGNKEGEGLLGTHDDFKQDGKGCREEGDDEQGGFVDRGLHARFNGENARQRKKELLRKFPPPLPSLVRTCNLPCYMPWVLLRSYPSDGRLVIQQFKAQHHEFFRAVRSNGRLIMHLVRHDQEKARAHQAEMFKAELHKTGAQDLHPNKEERTAVEEVHEEEVVEVGKDVVGEENAGKNSITGKNLGRDSERLTIEVSNAWSPRVLNRGETVPRDSGQMQMPCFSHPTSPHLQCMSSPIGMGSKGIESPVGSRCPPKSNPLFGRSLPTIRPILG